MKILAIDTSTARMTAALVTDTNQRELNTGELDGPQTHGEFLADQLRRLLAGEVPDLIAVGLGPGPYTGLRVGITTGEVLAHAWGISVVGVPTLAALAQAHRTRGGGECAAVLDVKRREIAWQVFGDDGTPKTDPRISPITDLSELQQYPIVGPAFLTQKLVEVEVVDASPVSAIAIAELAKTTPIAPIKPLYLRAPDAADPKPNKSVLSNG